MPTLREWIEGQAEGEAIEGVVVGTSRYGDDKIPSPLVEREMLKTWADVAHMFETKFYDGLGAPGCSPITAWTKSWVIGVSEYDGSTRPFRIPRNPTSYEPEFP